MPAIDWKKTPNQTITECLPTTDETPAVFNADELTREIRKHPCGKASGPDNIPNEVIKQVATRCPAIFLEAYNACLANGYFPDE